MATNNQNTQALVPGLRFPEFRKSGEWQLKETRDFLAQSRITSDQNDPTRRITVRLHLQGVEHREYRGTESVKAANNFIRKSGQFIYGKQNIHKGAFGIIPSQLDGFETSGDLPCFDFKSCCVPKWLMYHISREEIFRHLEFKMKGTGSKRLNEKTFLTLPIPAPPTPAEQQKIADCLGSLDDLIAAHSRKLAALQNHKKGLLQQLFPAEGETTPKLRFPGFEGEWTSNKLEDLCSAKISYGIVQAGPHVAGGMPYIKSTDLNTGLEIDSLQRTSEDIAKKYRRSEVTPGDLVFSLRGNIGVSQIIPDSIAVANLTQGTARIRSKGPAKFYKYALQSQRIHSRILGVSKGSTFQEISLDDLRRIEVLHPTLPEQQKIADCLSDLDALITAQAEQIAALKEHKKGLMQQLFPNPDLSKT